MTSGLETQRVCPTCRAKLVVDRAFLIDLVSHYRSSTGIPFRCYPNGHSVYVSIDELPSFNALYKKHNRQQENGFKPRDTVRLTEGIGRWKIGMEGVVVSVSALRAEIEILDKKGRALGRPKVPLGWLEKVGTE